MYTQKYKLALTPVLFNAYLAYLLKKAQENQVLQFCMARITYADDIYFLRKNCHNKNYKYSENASYGNN
jgi:hypothetical protein